VFVLKEAKVARSKLPPKREIDGAMDDAGDGFDRWDVVTSL
jgi:hypothetical protein